MSVVIRKAEEKDLLKVQRLVAKAGLRDEGIEQYIDHFLVVEDPNETMIGTVGIERYHRYGLLRSLVLDSPIWNAKLTLEFLELTLKYVEEQGVETIYLCAKGTNSFFHQLGFREVKETTIPKAIEASSHFQKSVGPDTKVWACELVD